MLAKLHDISPRITPQLAVFPGDTPFSSTHLLHLKQGDAVTLSTIKSTAHLGAHIDGPNHYDPQGKGIESVPLDRCIGPCQLITVDAIPSEYFGFNALFATPHSPREAGWRSAVLVRDRASQERKLGYTWRHA